MARTPFDETCLVTDWLARRAPQYPAKLDGKGREVMQDARPAHDRIAAELEHRVLTTGSDASIITPQQVTSAITAYQAEYGHKNIRIVSRADRAFRLYHGGKKRARGQRSKLAGPTPPSHAWPHQWRSYSHTHRPDGVQIDWTRTRRAPRVAKLAMRMVGEAAHAHGVHGGAQVR